MISVVVRVTSSTGQAAAIEGFSSIQCRLQLGAADELTIDMPLKTSNGDWRSDMPMFQVGAGLRVEVGYDGQLYPIQNFEVVGCEGRYSSNSLEIRGVSSLAKALRARAPRVVNGGNTEMLDQICSEHGWTNSVIGATGTLRATKEAGKTDLDLLRRIATDELRGGPRVNSNNELELPEPDSSNPLVLYRGFNDSVVPGWPIDDVSPSREGSGALKLSVIGWDPAEGAFVENKFQPNEFSGEAELVSRKKLKSSIPEEASTTSLLLRVTSGDGDREDIMSSGRYMNETDAVGLARRWFALRERLSRWATIKCDGHPYLLKPYRAVRLVGDLANMDRGVWLPTSVSHTVDNTGWKAEMKAIRVVDEIAIQRGTS